MLLHQERPLLNFCLGYFLKNLNFFLFSVIFEKKNFEEKKDEKHLPFFLLNETETERNFWL